MPMSNVDRVLFAVLVVGAAACITLAVLSEHQKQAYLSKHHCVPVQVGSVERYKCDNNVEFVVGTSATTHIAPVVIIPTR